MRCSACWCCRRCTICLTSRSSIKPGMGHVYAICRSWVGGLHSRRHDAVAVPREARAGRADRDAAKGYIARAGQMVDASIVPVPKQRNTRVRAKSRICARIEHVFGAQQTAPDGPGAHHRNRQGARQDRAAESRLQCSPAWERSDQSKSSPAGDVRTQEVSRFVQLGGPTGRRLMAESARRRSGAVPLRKSAQRRPLIIDEISISSNSAADHIEKRHLFEVPLNQFTLRVSQLMSICEGSEVRTCVSRSVIELKVKNGNRPVTA